MRVGLAALLYKSVSAQEFCWSLDARVGSVRVFVLRLLGWRVHRGVKEGNVVAGVAWLMPLDFGGW